VIRVTLDNPSCHGGDRLRGTIRSDEAPSRVAACWYTEGKGTPNSGPYHHASITPVGPGSFAFELPLPREPRSYDGVLVKIRWKLEVLVGGEDAEIPFELLPPRPRDGAPYREGAR
jgi:hypothetical protein